LHPVHIGQEEGCAGAGRYVLYVDDGEFILTESIKQPAGLRGGSDASGQFHRPAGEIVVLDVD